MLNRKTSLEKLQTEVEWDIIVIGGGATGLGIAVDAAQRGFKTLLVEKNDFAKGTSSRSTKLVHGGVRYLAQGNIKLVMEALRERGYLLSNAPHITRIQEFIIPAFSVFHQLYYGAGLLIYDLLSNRFSLGKPKLLGKRKMQKYLPGLKMKGVRGGILYTDGQFDDARLAISLALTAHDLGAVLLNYMPVNGLIKTDGNVKGVLLEDEPNFQTYEARGKAVINATGVFVDSILDMDDSASPAAVMPSQGVHLVIDKSFFPGTSALMIPKTKDGRVLFAVPWSNTVVIGTTDTALNGISEEPTALEEEINFILDHFNQYSNQKIGRNDVKSVFAGLRPLVKTSNTGSTALASRDHTIIVSPSNLITITGGKWTTYRKMAKDAVNNAAFVAKLPIVKCRTRRLHLHGYDNEVVYGQPLSAYGSDANKILELIKENSDWSSRLHPSYVYIKAEVIWAVRMEMAMQIEDVLARRLRLLFTDVQAAMDVAPEVARLMAIEMKCSREWKEEQTAAFIEVAKGYLA